MRLIGYTQAGNHPSPQLADQPGPLPKFANLNLAPPQSLQPQSTNNSFMQSQPSAIIPQNTATNKSVPQDPITVISPADYSKFSQLFIKTTGSPNSELNGVTAKDIFLKAKLSTTTLSQIWGLVDRENSGSLSLSGFVIAMHLIQGILSGSIKQLPPFLPESIWQSVSGPTPQVQMQPSGSRQVSHASIASQQTTVHSPAQRDFSGSTEWTVTPDQLQQFDQIFAGLDKSNSGQLSPDQVASFLMTSKLDQQDLASIWDLSDIQNTGIFTKLEFSIALFLVRKKLAGDQLPNIVPDALVNSIKQVQSGSGSGSAPAHVLAPAPAAPAPPAQIIPQKTAMDDLADVFSAPPQQPQPSVERSFSNMSQLSQGQRSSSNRASVSDVSEGLPKVRSNLTGSFKPTSTFGQSLMQKQPLLSPNEEEESLIGDDVYSPSPQASSPAVAPAPVPAPVPEKKAINYDALRAVPPPPAPAKRSSVIASSPATSSPQISEAGTPVREIPQYANNNDLLADNSEISGELSKATSDIANISNQVKSLTTHTTGLHEKKARSEEELKRILQTKAEIEGKLKQLRASFNNEVKQVEQVESNLTSAREETEALRSEASISEAKLNHLSTQLNEKQETVEELQKTNSSLKEKLGYLNAEIVELEKQLESKLAENKRLANQTSVKKSQVQVAIVKTEELKNKITELENSNRALQEEHDKAIEQERALEAERTSLSSKLQEATNFKPVTKSDKGLSTAAAAGIAGAVGAVGAIGAHVLGSENKEEHESKEPESKGPESKDILALVTAESSTPTLAPEENTQPSVPGAFNISGLVDEVKEKPSGDMTGVDDIEQVDKSGDGLPTASEIESAQQSASTQGFETSNSQFVDPPEEDIEELNERFPDLSANDKDNVTNQTTTSSIVTNSYKNTGDTETPVTSPSNSDFQFPQGSNAGVVGGMVGMPGVLVGVQRTDSLTSSVQNNAALSVRDDNIDDMSDRDTIDNIMDSGATRTEENTRGEGHEDSSENDKVSSGLDSFEMVNADDARGSDPHFAYQGNEDQNSETFYIKNPTTQPQRDEEFPPIRELDYDESDSSDDESQEKFDDAVDNFQSPAPAAPANDDFDAEFNDLTPAKEEATKETDLFDDFDDLKAAEVENNADDDEFGDENTEEAGFTTDFTDLPAGYSNQPDFTAESTQPKDTNDEWEQLFAGFGNQQGTPQQQQPAEFPTNEGSSQDEYLQELVGMGFERQTAIDALERENWNLEAATNYLLDHA